MAISRPVLRYPGGKYLIADWVIRHFPAHKLYVEPFGGAASVLLAKPRSPGEVYNDLNSEVVNVFRVLRDPEQAERLKTVIELTPFALDEYLSCWEPVDDPIEKARRMIFRSFAGIGSDSVFRNNGFRYSRQNKSGTVPAQGWMRYPSAIETFTQRLQGVVINNLDAFEILRKYDDRDTLFYIDPPYISSTRQSGSVHYDHELGTKDEHQALSNLLHSLKGTVVLSGYDSPLYRKLFSDFSFTSRSAKAGAGARRVECLWLSPNIKTTLF
jgi:DNA adenine methylase